MFNRSVTEQYRQLTAPDELRERVKTSVAAVRQPHSPKVWRAVAVAASLVLLFVGAVRWLSPAPVELSVNGIPFTSDKSVLSAEPAIARAYAEQTVELVFTCKGDMTVTAQDNGFFVRSNGEDSPLSPNTDHVAKGNITVICNASQNPKHLLINGRCFCVRYSEDLQAALVEEL